MRTRTGVTRQSATRPLPRGHASTHLGTAKDTPKILGRQQRGKTPPDPSWLTPSRRNPAPRPCGAVRRNATPRTDGGPVRVPGSLTSVRRAPERPTPPAPSLPSGRLGEGPSRFQDTDLTSRDRPTTGQNRRSFGKNCPQMVGRGHWAPWTHRGSWTGRSRPSQTDGWPGYSTRRTSWPRKPSRQAAMDLGSPSVTWT